MLNRSARDAENTETDGLHAADTRLILASSSPRRQELIRYLGLPVIVQVSEADETVPADWSPPRIVEELALRKAQAVLNRQESPSYKEKQQDTAWDKKDIIVGSDTIVVLDGEVLGKPRDESDALRMLRMLQGRQHLVYSGVACLSTDERQRESGSGAHPDFAEAEANTGITSYGDIGRYCVLSQESNGQPVIIVGHTVSQVTFRPMSGEELDTYIKTGEPLDKAGSYGVQGAGARYIEKIQGDFYSIMGLPVNLLYRMLQQFSGVV